MTEPLFSIITVTLNNLSGLKKTAESIFPQTHQDYEWITIDGGSTDGTPAYLGDLKTNYISEPDKGIYDAMNKGIERAKGQYILFLNAGDMLESKNTLLEVNERIKGQKCDFIYGDSAEDINGKLFFKRSKPHFEITKGMFTHHQAMLYNRDALENIKYDETYKIAADYDLTWKVIEQSTDFLYLPFPVCIFEAGGASQQQVLLGRSEQFKIRKAHGVSILKNSLIFIGQTILYRLRCLAPKLYWLLKR